MKKVIIIDDSMSFCNSLSRILGANGWKTITCYSYKEGMKAKDCYRFYTDIRRRKNYSRTYFLDKMQEKLNEKMRRDDELERLRR